MTKETDTVSNGLVEMSGAELIPAAMDTFWTHWLETGFRFSG